MSTTKFVVDGVEVAQTLNNLVLKFGRLCADQKLTPVVSTKSTAATRPSKVWTEWTVRSDPFSWSKSDRKSGHFLDRPKFGLGQSDPFSWSKSDRKNGHFSDPKKHQTATPNTPPPGGGGGGGGGRKVDKFISSIYINTDPSGVVKRATLSSFSPSKKVTKKAATFMVTFRGWK